MYWRFTTFISKLLCAGVLRLYIAVMRYCFATLHGKLLYTGVLLLLHSKLLYAGVLLLYTVSCYALVFCFGVFLNTFSRLS